MTGVLQYIPLNYNNIIFTRNRNLGFNYSDMEKIKTKYAIKKGTCRVLLCELPVKKIKLHHFTWIFL